MIAADMTAPRVTIIMATYNWSTVLPFSIASALAQTFRDFELLVIGDGCTDDSEAVVSQIGDPRVRWINLSQHTRNQSGPNNRGLQEARGEFIAYLGHDDLWLPHHLECGVDAMQAGRADLSHGIVGRVLPDSLTASALIGRPEAGLWVPPTAVIHRRGVTDAVGGWKDYRDLWVAPETDLWRRAGDAGFSFVFVARLIAIKLPARIRRNVYRDRPCHEQTHWLRRITSEPSFEAAVLASMLQDDAWLHTTKASALIVSVTRELFARLRRRLSSTSALRRRVAAKKGANVDEARIFKGL